MLDTTEETYQQAQRAIFGISNKQQWEGKISSVEERRWKDEETVGIWCRGED